MAEDDTGGKGTTQRLEQLITRARTVLLWERAWPPVAALLSVVVLFLAVSWLGVWDVLPHAARMVGVAAFGLLLIGAAAYVAQVRRPERRAALARLDLSAGMSHRPATAIDDGLAASADDPFTRAIWEAHRARAEAAASRLRVARPSPRLDRFDPRALRFLLALFAVVAFFAAGSDRTDRVAAAFDWWTEVPPPLPPRVDAWVAPPAYTGRPPLFLTGTASTTAAAISVPVGSTLLVRTSGGDVSVEAGGQVVPSPEDPAKPASSPAPPAVAASPANAAAAGTAREFRFSISGDGSLRIAGQGLDARDWTFTALPDRPPPIELKSPPSASARGGFVIPYAVSDDYGVVGAEARYVPVPRAGAQAPARPIYEAPRTTLALPQARMRSGDASTTTDLQEHPWAGAAVDLRLVARDEAGQEGQSRSTPFKIPGRTFAEPLARALVEQRRELALDAGARPRVLDALDALAMFPERFDVSSTVYLGLRTAYWRLDNAAGDDDLRSVADYLWEMALSIEDGDMTDAERQLRAAQEALKQALDRDASPEEVQRLTEQLRQAMNEFMRELSKQLAQAPSDPRGTDPNQRMVRPQDLQRMLDRMEQLSKKGERQAAKDMLAELSQMLNNLRNAKRAPRNQNAEAMGKMLDELGDMIRQQNQLRDKTFKEGRLGNGDPSRRGQPQRGQQRGQQPGGEQPGGEPGEGEAGGMGDLAQSQKQLREKLEQLQRQLKQRGMQGEGLGEAGEAMEGAEGSLGEGDAGNAVDKQGRALEALRKGAQNLASKMAGDEPGDEPGEGQPSARRGDGEELDTDPLGRPTRSRAYDSGNSVKVPGEIEAQRARRVLEDIRRRLSEPTRPTEELQYLERLLEQ